MLTAINEEGYRAGIAAFASTVAYDAAQLLQLMGVLSFPLDEILIYGTSLCIAAPFLIEMLAFNQLAGKDKQFWTHIAVLFTVIYAASVSSNYIVQLAAVIPAKLSGHSETVRLLEQTPHSLFWKLDALGYISLGIASLAVIPALKNAGFEKWVRIAFLANALVTPLIAFVYFYPWYSQNLLLLGLPWAVTAPACMLLLALMLHRNEWKPILPAQGAGR